MNAGQTLEAIRQKFPDAISSESTERGEASILVVPERWIELARWLAGEGGFSLLSDLCAVDWPGRAARFEIVYQLTDIQNPRLLRVKLPVAGEPPTAPSVTSIWPAADWLEREAYDMYGVAFEGHPDLRRILMPDEWEGHPQRKDYSMGKVPVEYKHLSPGF
jgi:NADH-quinone oxidoreductase subunit C